MWAYGRSRRKGGEVETVKGARSPGRAARRRIKQVPDGDSEEWACWRTMQLLCQSGNEWRIRCQIGNKCVVGADLLLRPRAHARLRHERRRITAPAGSS